MMIKSVTDQARQYHFIKLHSSLELFSKTPRKIPKSKGFSMGKGKYGPVLCDENEVTVPAVPICIILGWLAAKRRHLMKFASVYLEQGLDVLLVFSTPASAPGFANPMGTLKRRAELLYKFLQHNRDTYEGIFIHGFSAGAIVWGLFLHQVKEDGREYDWIQGKIQGQFWDSQFLDAGRIPTVGSSVVFPDNRIGQIILNTFGIIIMTALDDSKLGISEAFQCDNFKCPYLIVGSEDDHIAPACSLAACAERWQKVGNAVFWKMWKRSPHVRHMKENCEEYKALWEEFLWKVGLLKYPARFQIATLKNTKDKSA